jgi:2-methylisocitrate lyase-like PEP mutase family enzyme
MSAVSRQQEKGSTFLAMHVGEPFMIPNPWDVGSARVLEALGFTALATTSSGFAFTLGLVDGGVTLDQMASHVAAIDAATDLPVSADLENGYGPDPADAAEAIGRVAMAGAVGGSIEDFDRESRRLYEIGHAAERIRAAVEAAHGVGFPFTLTARAENHIRGNADLADGGSDRSRKPAPTSCTRRGWAPSRRSARCAMRSRSRSMFSPYPGCP